MVALLRKVLEELGELLDDYGYFVNRYRYTVAFIAMCISICLIAALVHRAGWWDGGLLVAVFVLFSMPGVTFLIGVLEYYERLADDRKEKRR